MDSDSFEFTGDIIKAEQSPSGRIRVHGVASDESLDLDEEVVKASGIASSLGYLNRYGKLNWNHKGDDIGDIVNASLASPSEIANKGLVDDAGRIVNNCLYFVADVYPDGKNAPSDVQKAHYYLDVGAKLGASIQGRVLKRNDKQVTKCFINRIALTPHPINANSGVYVMKSLAPSPCDDEKCKDGT